MAYYQEFSDMVENPYASSPSLAADEQITSLPCNLNTTYDSPVLMNDPSGYQETSKSQLWDNQLINPDYSTLLEPETIAMVGPARFEDQSIQTRKFQQDTEVLDHAYRSMLAQNSFLTKIQCEEATTLRPMVEIEYPWHRLDGSQMIFEAPMSHISTQAFQQRHTNTGQSSQIFLRGQLASQNQSFEDMASSTELFRDKNSVRTPNCRQNTKKRTSKPSSVSHPPKYSRIFPKHDGSSSFSTGAITNQTPNSILTEKRKNCQSCRLKRKPCLEGMGTSKCETCQNRNFARLDQPSFKEPDIEIIAFLSLKKLRKCFSDLRKAIAEVRDASTINQRVGDFTSPITCNVEVSNGSFHRNPWSGKNHSIDAVPASNLGNHRSMDETTPFYKFSRIEMKELICKLSTEMLPREVRSLHSDIISTSWQCAALYDAIKNFERSRFYQTRDVDDFEAKHVVHSFGHSLLDAILIRTNELLVSLVRQITAAIKLYINQNRDDPGEILCALSILHGSLNRSQETEQVMNGVGSNITSNIMFSFRASIFQQSNGLLQVIKDLKLDFGAHICGKNSPKLQRRLDVVDIQSKQRLLFNIYLEKPKTFVCSWMDSSSGYRSFSRVLGSGTSAIEEYLEYGYLNPWTQVIPIYSPKRTKQVSPEKILKLSKSKLSHLEKVEICSVELRPKDESNRDESSSIDFVTECCSEAESSQNCPVPALTIESSLDRQLADLSGCGLSTLYQASSDAQREARSDPHDVVPVTPWQVMGLKQPAKTPSATILWTVRFAGQTDLNADERFLNESYFSVEDMAKELDAIAECCKEKASNPRCSRETVPVQDERSGQEKSITITHLTNCTPKIQGKRKIEDISDESCNLGEPRAKKIVTAKVSNIRSIGRN